MAPSGGVLVLLLLIPAHCFAQEILHAPESTTVFLNQPAVFTCETTGGITSWSVNGTQREILLPEIRVDLVVSENTTPEGTTVQNLTIPARAQYNGTRIQCQSGLFGGSSVESDNATLTIQGTPSEVGDLRTISNASSVTISWSAPFSLNVTGVDPDIWYSVLIYNVTDENNPTAILCTDCINITETHYTFTPDYLSPCHVYNFSVIPLNGAGQGESSPFITGYVINLSALIETHIRAISRDENNVTFTSNPTSGFCSSWRVTPDVDDDDLVIEEPPSPEGPDVTYQLRADNRYSFLVSLSNTTSGVAPLRINFTTYDVQSAAADTTKGTNNKINLNGEFIKDTTAKGCFVVLQCEYGNPDVFIALLLPDDSSTYVQSTIHDILSSTYNMFVYDLEEDGLPDSHPAVEQNTTVNVTGNGPIADAESEFINNASLYWNGSAVTITCEFKEGIEGASCVLVYREYGNKTLLMKKYHQNTVFPKTLTVGGDLEKYTFAIFGKDGSIVDQRPIIAGRMNVTETTTPTITEATFSDGRVSSVAIGVSATVLCIIVILVILAVVVLILWRKSHKGGYSSSDVVPSCFCSPSPSECSNASVASGSQLISDDGGTKPKKDGPAEGEAKPPFSGKSSYQRQDGDVSVSTPPVISKQKGVYTDVELPTSGVQPPIPEDSIVQYTEVDIRTTHKMALSQYADLGPLPTNRPNPPKIETKTQCPYVDVLPHATTPDNGNGDKKNADKATPKGPPTVESVMSLLWGVAGRWKEIAEGLEFDEDLIDEIDTNNDTDEGCLQVCVGMWVTKLQPSWEKLSHVLKELGEVELARQVGSEESQPQVKSFQCTSKGDSEVVTGTHGNTPPLTDSNIDGNRGVEKLMADEEPKPVVHQSSALSGDEKVYYCYTSVEEGIIPSQELTTTFFHKPKSRYILKVDGACVVVVNINARPGVTEGSVNMQQTDHFRQRSVARSEPTSKPTEPQLDSSHPGCGGSYEVVNGVERAILPFDDNDGENRGAKSTMPNGSSTLPYLNNFTVQGGKEYDKALAESPLTTKGKRHHTFDTPMLAHGAGSICFAEENICVLPVNNEGEEDSHPDPTGSWRQESADNSCTVQGDARDMVPEGDEIIPFANIPPTLPHKDAGKCVCPPLGFEAKEGELVVGGLNEKSSLLDPSSVEPSPVAVQPQPEDSTSLQSEIQLQESGRSSELVPRHQGRENDMTKPMKWQDHNQGVLVRGLQRLGVPLSCILLMTGTKSCCKVHIPDASYK